MNSDLNEDQWKDIADTLRELNIDFDRRVETLFSKRPKIFPAPPTRPTPGSGICMAMVVEEEPGTTPQVSPIVSGQLDGCRPSALLNRKKKGDQYEIS